jgi:hypothetical protein
MEEQELGKMLTRALTDLIVALLHKVVDPCHRHCGRGGATNTRLSTLHFHHHHRHLRQRHTTACWSGPHPLPSTGRRTGRWSSRTLTPIQWVVR